MKDCLLLVTEVTTKELWGPAYALMTDAVTKNFKIEVEVSQKLEPNQAPAIHLLCKSHTCEKLDECCLNTSKRTENDLNMTELVIQRSPQIKSFVKQTRCLAICALKTTLKLVSNEVSAMPKSLAREFEVTNEEDNVAKSPSLFKE